MTDPYASQVSLFANALTPDPQRMLPLGEGRGCPGGFGG